MAVERTPYDVDRPALRRLVSENYPQIAANLLEPLFDVMRLAREACGGDMDKAFIILVVAIRTAGHPDFSSYTKEQLETGSVHLPSLGTNVRSIADSLGAPRETVRRKVRELVEAGWIAQEHHELSYTPQAAKQLSAVRSSVEQMAVKNFETVAGLLQRPEGGGRA